jgi:hypothetical protein
MLSTPWCLPESLFLNKSIVLRTTKGAYFRWIGIVIIALFGTYLAYDTYRIFPQIESQLALCLMIGVNAWIMARLGELLVRRTEVDFTGLHIRTLFTNESVTWDQVMHIEWWRGTYRSARYTNYRLSTAEKQTIATFSDDAWTNLPEGIGYAATAAYLVPVRIKVPIPELYRVAMMILTPFMVILFTMERNEIWRIIGFVLIRVFWTALIMHYTRYELRIARFYMTLLSLTFVAALIVIAGATFWQTLVVLLYTPLLEIAVSAVVFRVQGYWKRLRESQQATSNLTDI